MEVGILGPLVVRDDSGAPVELSGARVRTLLARLALDAGRPVGVGPLVDAVWGAKPPADEANALQTLVSRLRRTLGTQAIVQSPAGYRLAIDAQQTDLGRFDALTSEATTATARGDRAAALSGWDDALALWRGPALTDVTSDSLQELAAALDERRASASLDRAAARLDVDPDGVDVAELERLVAQRPLDERASALLVRTLAATGRQPDALQAYEGLRSRLADELGVDPSAELRELHLSLLRGADTERRVARRTNLKAPLTSFVGREDDLSRVAKLLETNRLVTLVGPGGAGKTRLASEAGARVLDATPDGVWLTELAAVTDGADVPDSVYGSLGMREVHAFDGRRGTIGPRNTEGRLRETLTDRTAVLVLDNCEHVIDAVARLAETLLSECPGLRVLATSREPLGIGGETLLAVPPLGMPTPDSTPADALTFAAVRLFVDRAAAVAPQFAIDCDTVGPVVEIVRRLDGLPLAIELAAARLRTLPVTEIAARLGDRFRLLTGGSRTALPRHRTLRAVVEWSWEMLTDDERQLAEILSVYPAGVTRESAGALRPESLSDEAVDDALASLIDKSLLETADGGRRMRMLETIREYGTDRLAERGELGPVRRRHAEYFADLAAEAEPHLTTAGQVPWFRLLTAERENILAALRFYIDAEEPDNAFRLALSLGMYGMLLGAHADISVWTSAALAIPGGEDPALRVMTEALIVLNATASGEVESSIPKLDELKAKLGELPPSLPNRMATLIRPFVAFLSGDIDLAQQWADQALQNDDAWVRASAYMFRANFAENSGDLVNARKDSDIALREFERLGERWGMSSVLRNIAQFKTSDGDLVGAIEAYERARAYLQELDSDDDEIFVNARLADLALRMDDARLAREHTERLRESMGEKRSPMEAAFALVLLGELEYRLGRRDEGLQLVEAALVKVRDVSYDYPGLGHARAYAHIAAGRLAVREGDIERATTLLEEGRVSALGTKDQPVVAAVGVALATLVRADDPTRAATLLGAAARLRGADDLTDLDISTLTAQLRDDLGDETFRNTYDEGRALPVEAALALFGDSV